MERRSLTILPLKFTPAKDEKSTCEQTLTYTSAAIVSVLYSPCEFRVRANMIEYISPGLRR